MITFPNQHYPLAVMLCIYKKFDSGDKITIMVNKKILSLYGAKLPEIDQERDIKMGRPMIRIVFCGC